jgi:rhodanese-related sulfurtransferase
MFKLNGGLKLWNYYANTKGGASLAKNHLKRLVKIMLPVLLILVAILSNGCSTESKVPNQTETLSKALNFVTPKEAFNLIKTNQDNPNFVIIDDRQISAFNSGHIKKAINIPTGTDFKDRIGNLDKDKIYLISCRIGCGHTSNMMKQLGFREVYEIEGGLDAWTSQGLPIYK